MRDWTCWAVQFRSSNKLDGPRDNLMSVGCLPALYLTRQEARAAAEKQYGYIRQRPDLRAEPHGWMLARAVKVRVTVEAKP